MRVALTGTSGFIGAATARALAIAGHEVVGLVRPTSRRNHVKNAVSRFVVGDQADRASWSNLLEGAHALVHNSLDRGALDRSDLEAHLSSNLVGSILLLEDARRAGVQRVVFVSSVAVHHDIRPRWAGAHLVDEDHPLRPRSLYGAYKAAIEAHLWAFHHTYGIHAVAVRPAAVYGVDPCLERSHGYQQVRKLLHSERVSKADFPGGGKWVHVDDVALAIVRSLERDAAAGKPFHLADCYAKFTRLGEHAAGFLGLPQTMVEPDTAPAAMNTFDKTAAREILGVPLSRGDNGLKAYAADLVNAVKANAE